MEKPALRRRMRAVRRALDLPLRASLSAAIAEHLVGSPEWETARAVALYAALPEEVDTLALVDAARAAGKRVGLPRVTGREAPLSFLAPAPGAALQRGAFDVLEPPEHAPVLPPDEIELVVVPALAVDDDGYRLGYGGGYYDRTLPLLPRARRVAVIFHDQRVASVPRDAWDTRLHAVVTERGIRRF